MIKKLHWYDAIFILLFVYLFVLQLIAIWPFTIDDMYIPLRYAKNWASGDGLLWNIHEPPVEGYSNFSFLVLATVSILFNLNPVMVLKSMGVIGLFISCVFIYLICRFWLDKRQSFVSCLFILLYKGQIVWAVSGLETTVYQSLIVAAVYFIFKGLGYQYSSNQREIYNPGSFLLAGLCLSIAAVTRPEAPALILIFFILIGLDRPKYNIKQYKEGVLLFILPILILYLPYFIGRSWYYGYLFPNSVYCKGYAENSFLVLDREYLRLILPFILFALPACLMRRDLRHFYLWVPSVVYALMLSHSDPIVAFYNRLFLPAFILLVPLTLQGINLCILFFTKSRNSIYYFTFFIVSILFAMCFIPKMSLSEYQIFTKNPIAGEQLRDEVIQWLNSNKPFKSVVLADSGMIPFYSKLNFIDSYCLNNREMSHYPKKQMYELFCQNILNKKPEVIILTSLIEKGEIIYTPSDLCLKGLLGGQRDYRLVKEFSTNNPESVYRYELFSRVD